MESSRDGEFKQEEFRRWRVSEKSIVATYVPCNVSSVWRTLRALVHVHHMYWAHPVIILCLNYPCNTCEFYFPPKRTARHLSVASCRYWAALHAALATDSLRAFRCI